MNRECEIVKMIKRAHREHWALGQFNMSNMETLQAIVTAANELRSPVIVGVSMGTLRHAGLAYIQGLMKAAKSEAQVPIFFHLDHGPNFETIKRVIAAGFDSVMIDTSKLPFEENVEHVRRAAEYAHAEGVGIEAQIGETWDEETGDTIQVETEPEEVRAFVEGSGIDYLAFSFGNTPGRIEGESSPDLNLIEKIAEVSAVPLVLHGGTSIPAEATRQAIALGAVKINIDTHIRKAVSYALKEAYSKEDFPLDPRIPFGKAREAAVEAVKEKIRLFGSERRAGEKAEHGKPLGPLKDEGGLGAWERKSR